MTNPLGEEQREKKGAETFGKYQYQYHWALYKLLDEHAEGKEYAIFVELHEDVVLSNSLQKETAEFEFYQIKENSGSSQYTSHSLTVINKGEKNSVLGKLIQSYDGKAFKDVVSSASIVSTGGFSDKMLKKNLKLEEITLKDLNLSSYKKLKNCILDELALEQCPVNIRFIIPKLKPDADRDMVVAAIVDLIDTLYPSSQCDSTNIYRTLIDELHRKGTVTYDYSEWDALLKNKALTSETVQNAIETHSSIKGLEEIEKNTNDLLSDLDIGYTKRRQLQETVKKYYIRKLSNQSGFSIKLGQEVQQLYSGLKHLDTKELLNSIENELSEGLKKSLMNAHELRAAVICEIIESDI